MLFRTAIVLRPWLKLVRAAVATVAGRAPVRAYSDLPHGGGFVGRELNADQARLFPGHAPSLKGLNPSRPTKVTRLRSQSALDVGQVSKPGSSGEALFAAESEMRKRVLVIAVGLVLSACSGSSDDKREIGNGDSSPGANSSDDELKIWNGDSTGIEFELTGATGQRLCEFSATREELTEAELDGLAALRLQDAAARAGCDIPTYSITIRGADGSSVRYRATHVDCSSSPILLFEDFDTWAKTSPCSLAP